MNRYVAIPSRHLRNTKTGATASLYGAHPAKSPGDFQNWLVVTNGWTIHDLKENRIGGFQSCPPGSSQEHAESVAAHLNALTGNRTHG
jgi:hypothetical protein